MNNIFALDVKIVDVSLGCSHGIALSADGAVYAWGTHERAKLSRPTPQVLHALSSSFKPSGNI